MTKVMISAGEASGDLHGASVAEALKSMQPEIELLGMGGSNMRAAGVDIVYDIADIGVMGFVEILRNLPMFFRLRNILSQIMDERRPDVLVLIDYGGFHMAMAQVAKKKDIPVVYYICPKAWVWGKWRAKAIAGWVKKVAAIFPFEADIYREAGASVEFVGHPLVDIVRPSMDREAAYRHFGADPNRPLLLLLPGSRYQEVSSLLELMLAAARKVLVQLPDCQFYLPVASTIPMDRIESVVQASGVPVVFTRNSTYNLMQIADCAIAASGTVTLEAALMGLPSVIIYRVKTATYWLIRVVADVSHVGLPNIVVGRRILPELIQNDVTADSVCREALRLMTDSVAKAQVKADLQEVRIKLGEPGAVRRVARIVLDVAAEAKL
ncbi:MAG TPA: lipid-A-disaccharide synthase [Negativicutes bacterium]|nr:lipid-A-disaccharide synthase [Negativicutes bacterium]